ncbi:MAG TPA: periplasmic heavy metal sensor [Bacteroidota bacterium]|nr:periplasmic heavy metal sensor [Bacteroidota bacterium]
MKRLLIILTLTALTLSAASAQWGAGQQKRGGNMRERLVTALKLTDEQKKTFESLRVDMEKKSIEQQAHIRTARLELRELFKADQPNQSAIEKKLGELSQLQTQRRSLVVDHWFAVNKMLTPDQQKVWKKASARFLQQARTRFARGRAQQFMRDQGMRNQGMRNRFAQPPGGATSR